MYSVYLRSLFVLMLFVSLSAHGTLRCRALFQNQSAGLPEHRFQVNDASSTKSQLIRDNHLDYSFFVGSYREQVAKERPELLSALDKLIRFKGWISGDNHSGNYVVSAVNGKLKYYFVDIKDGGRGPLFYNLANLVLNTHAVAKLSGLKIAEVADTLIASYMKGLKQQGIKVPTLIMDALKTDISEYREMQDADVDRFLNKKGKFNFNKDNILPLETLDANTEKIKTDVVRHLQTTGLIKNIIDFAVRPKDRGGSKDLKRVWALVETTDGRTRIIEFKEVNIPAAQAVESSGLNLKDHTLKMMSVYFPEVDAMVKPVSLDGSLYMMRQRKVELVSVPYKQNGKHDLDDLMSLAGYAAYTTGLKHAQFSLEIPGYTKAIEDAPADFQLLLRSLVKDYYSHLDGKSEE